MNGPARTFFGRRRPPTLRGGCRLRWYWRWVGGWRARRGRTSRWRAAGPRRGRCRREGWRRLPSSWRSGRGAAQPGGAEFGGDADDQCYVGRSCCGGDGRRWRWRGFGCLGWFGDGGGEGDSDRERCLVLAGSAVPGSTERRLSGCGDRVTPYTAPSGTVKSYSITVTGTGTSSSGAVLTHSAVVTLVVQ